MSVDELHEKNTETLKENISNLKKMLIRQLVKMRSKINVENSFVINPFRTGGGGCFPPPWLYFCNNFLTDSIKDGL